MKAHLFSWWDQTPSPLPPAHPLGWMCLAEVRDRHNSSQEGDVACPGDNLGTGQEVQCPHHDQCSCVTVWEVRGGPLGTERVWKGKIPAGNAGLVRKVISRTQGCTSAGQNRQELPKEAMLGPRGISGMRKGSGAGGASHRHVGNRTCNREEFGRSGLTFLQIPCLSFPSCDSCVPRHVSTTADGFQWHVGRVSRQ